MKAVRPIANCVLAIFGSALEICYLSWETMRRNPKRRITIDVSPHRTRSDDIAVTMVNPGNRLKSNGFAAS